MPLETDSTVLYVEQVEEVQTTYDTYCMLLADPPTN